MQSIRLLLPFLLSALFLLIGCKNDQGVFIQANIPQLIPVETWRATTIELDVPQFNARMGKNLIHDNYLFVNEVLKGVHFYDNTDPSNPINLGFLPVHANLEMAAMDDLLYLDSYYDLLTFDISDINNPSLVDRQEDVFQFLLYRRFSSYTEGFPSLDFDQNNQIVLGWSLGEIDLESQNNADLDNDCENSGCHNSDFPSVRGRGFISTSLIVGSAKPGLSERMIRRENYLYTLERNAVRIFQLPGIPALLGEVSKKNTEITIQATDLNLWVGHPYYLTSYDLTNPATPVNFSILRNFNQCEPLITDGNRAYKTQYASNPCHSTVNQLMVMDISDLHFPETIATYNMAHPEGLAIDGNLLFVCEGEAGLKVYDRTNDLDLGNHLLSHLTDIQPHDIYAEDGLATIAGEGVIYQYSYADPENLVYLSAIVGGSISN